MNTQKRKDSVGAASGKINQILVSVFLTLLVILGVSYIALADSLNLVLESLVSIVIAISFAVFSARNF